MPTSFTDQTQPTPLLGRSMELQTIEDRLLKERVQLLSITGPAGVGKTRLANPSSTFEALPPSNGRS